MELLEQTVKIRKLLFTFKRLMQFGHQAVFVFVQLLDEPMKHSTGKNSLFKMDTDRHGQDSGILVLQAVTDIDFRRFYSFRQCQYKDLKSKQL